MLSASRHALRSNVFLQLTRSTSTASDLRGSQTITLPDGRTLGYSEYGNPQGTPVFYVHGVPDSRIAIRNSDEIAKRLNIRFIGIDRPGMGLSTFYPNRKVLDFPSDLQHLAEHLQLDQYRILSVSGGTGYGRACAKVLPEADLRSVGILVGVGPWEGGTKGMTIMNRIGLNMWAYPLTRRMMETIYNYWIIPIAHDPDSTKLDNLMKNQMKYLKESDRKAFEKPGEFELTVDIFREVWKQGMEGQVEEERLVTSHWGFELEDVKYDRIKMWYGSDDVNTPPRMGEDMAKRLPHAELQIFPGKSHFTMWDHIEQVLTELLKDD